MSARYAVLFKCHQWSDFEARQLERLRQRVGRGDIFVLPDKAAFDISTGGVAAISVCETSQIAAAAIGLHHSGEAPCFWYNNDYPLHIFRERFPSYDYYVMVEYDVYCAVDLDQMIDRLAALRVDFVGQPILTPLREWPWLESCAGWYREQDILHWLSCISVFSNNAARYLYRRRVSLSDRVRAGDATRLPMCEAVLATELNLAGFRLMRLSDLGNTMFYNTWPPYTEQSLRKIDVPSFVHPVLDEPRFLNKVANRGGNHISLVTEYSRFRQLIGKEEMFLALPAMHWALWANRDDRGRKKIIELMRESSDPSYREVHSLDGKNVALNSPAAQSSLSPFSFRPDEAIGATLGPVSGRPTFHTHFEERPWWTVDLEAVLPVSVVKVFNSMDFPERAIGLELLLSLDGTVWEKAGAHVEHFPFGGASGEPLVVKIERQARFVRLQLPGTGFLHLDQVQVYS